jgi:uncharacterized protein with gpF-like domain
MAKEIKIPAIRANEGLSIAFQKKLDALIDEMNNSVLYWVSAAYKKTPPEMAKDASPAVELDSIIKKLTRKWNKRFADAAPDMADYFAKAAKDRTDGALRAALKKSGFAVEFKVTREINDILQATARENVSLIKTISQEYLSDVEQLVMRSVTTGRDLGGLRADIEKRFGITKNRARLISRQSNNNCTAMLKRARESELGITESIWHHSHAGKVPRPEHESWNGKKYNIKTGMWSEVAKKWVWPGTDFNCRCYGTSIIPRGTLRSI